MKHAELLNRNNQLLRSLSGLPRKIISLHGEENVPEFVLHDLCHPECFDLDRAAYFVDNPDFDCLKGVAGFERASCPIDAKMVWQDPTAFTKYMQNSAFNKQVKNIVKPSCRKNGYAEADLVKALAQELHINRPEYHSWNMKHDNHGILIYERGHTMPEIHEYLQNGVYLLSFCPIA